VCEFHYLHHAVPGGHGAQAHADPLDMSLALVRAAQKVGMGLTLLPTLYQRSGFGAAGLRPDQMRFASTTDSLLRLVDDLQMQVRGLVNFNVGVALHSLRAAEPAAITEVAAFADAQGLPVHIHIAEQIQEVHDCLAHTGQRPIEWLLDHLPVNARWNLVHATHTTAAELASVGRRGAAIVICPSTEANLGDGVFDYPGYAAVGGVWSIGSDSHVTRSWTEELRSLEYSQRLALRQRNVAGRVDERPSTAANLFEAAVAGGAAAAGQPLGALALGNRADFQVLDAQSPALLGVPDESVLDALIFSSPGGRAHQVYVAGQLRVNGARLANGTSQADLWPGLAQRFVQTMRALWS
jgi:formimidoylglutamate deiminase